MKDSIEITVINWSKYQPASDRVRRPHWFRVNMDCATSNGLYDLTAEQCWVWVQILCECCRKNSDTVCLNIRRLSKLSNASYKVIAETIDMLSKNGTLIINSAETQHKLLLQNITEQNITEQNITNKSSELICINPRIEDGLDNVLDFVCKPTELEQTILNHMDASLYPDPDFLGREIKKIVNWLNNNSHKQPRSNRGWHRFVSGWLERGWDRYRKSLPTTTSKPKILSLEELEEK